MLTLGLVHATPSIEGVVPFIIWWLAPAGMKYSMHVQAVKLNNKRAERA